jgi:hypothetical protein
MFESVRRAPLALALVLVLAGVAVAGDEADPKAETPKAEIGKKVPDFTTTDVEGKAFQLSKAAFTRADAEGAVRAAAGKFGAAKDAPWTTPIADLSGVKDEDGELDTALVRDLACAAGMQLGLTATEDTIEGYETLGDLVDWIAGAIDAPLLFVAWSPNCPSVKGQNDRFVEVVAKSGVRAFVLACNTRDTEEHYTRFKDTFEFNIRIFPDREQKVTDILGGTKTPHYFLVDKTGVLRYRGALDNDAMGYMDDEERDNWVLDAVAALKAGKELAQTETEPSG